MTTALRRYQFSERLADILGESRRDLRFRVTLMITGGLVAPGPRGPGSPPATPAYAADFLIGVMAAPQQVDTVEAIRCYRALRPVGPVGAAPGIALAAPGQHDGDGAAALPLVLADRPPFGEALARLIDRARDAGTAAALARDVVGLWIGRGFPAAGLHFAVADGPRRRLATQRYELPEGANPPAWLDPESGGRADPGLFHTVFLPVRKLVEIGALTSPDERTTAMPGLGQTISELAALARKTGHKRPWETFLSKAALSEQVAEDERAHATHLTRVTGFGSNPGNLRMMMHVPKVLAPSPGLVVVLHGCTQTAASYDIGTGWSTLADRHGFVVLLPEQKRRNNPLRCFNWFRPADIGRDDGEALSIRQMVEHACTAHGIDRRRIFVTGVSAGGAMTAAMLATYPDVFAGGAVIAGVPYRAAEGLQEGFEAIFQGRSQSPRQWGDHVRAASPHRGPWPRVSVWHGDADGTVTPLNAAELLKQWTDVHGLPSVPTIESEIDGHPHLIWQTADGQDVVESYTVRGMGHGVPIDPHGPDGCGAAGPFLLDVGLSSTLQIARSWGLTDTRVEAPQPQSQPAGTGAGNDRPGQAPRETVIDADMGEPVRTADPRRLVAEAFESSGLLRTARTDQPGGSGGARTNGEARGTRTGRGGGGVDVSSILRKSLEIADFATGGGRKGGAGTIAGVDIPGIIGKSFELAGLMRTPGQAAAEGTPSEAAPTGPAKAAAGAADDGWQLLAGDRRALTEGAVLFGYAASGIANELGHKTRRVSCRLVLGEAPVLSYRRRLDLTASANMTTTAAFRVLVDEVPVDEATVTGMDHGEPDWTERAGIDLSRFARRTVTLTFEVTANANVLVEVSAKAWVSDIVVAAGGRTTDTTH